MSSVWVRKLNTRGELVVAYKGHLAEHLPNGVLLRATWDRGRLDLGYTVFEPGATFMEWFFTDRWYNIFEISSAGGELKGWYCNVAEPAVISEGEVSYRDLHLDVWASARGGVRILDEEEFAADPWLDAMTRARARDAVGELRALVRQRRPPFDRVEEDPRLSPLPR